MNSFKSILLPKKVREELSLSLARWIIFPRPLRKEQFFEKLLQNFFNKIEINDSWMTPFDSGTR